MNKKRKLKENKRGVDAHTTVKPGKYWLGDPCYVIGSDNDVWMHWLEDANFRSERHLLDGKVPSGNRVIAFGTKYGDGEYDGTDGHSYSVDAGLIGLVPVNIPEFDSELVSTGTIVNFDKATDCWSADGFLNFGDIEIDTAQEEDEEDEDDYDYDWNEDNDTHYFHESKDELNKILKNAGLKEQSPYGYDPNNYEDEDDDYDEEEEYEREQLPRVIHTLDGAITSLTYEFRYQRELDPELDSLLDNIDELISDFKVNKGRM